MEGSRHEKAALISVSYFIGAVTVFIGFYTVNSTTELNAIYPSTQSAAVISAVPTGPVDESVVGSTVTTVNDYYGNVTYQDGILAIETITGRKIISYNPDVSGLDVATEFVSQGIHTGTITYLVAPGDQYVFFCEEKDVAGVCVPFIYDTDLDKVYKVTVNSADVLFSTAQAKTVAWGIDGLSIPNMTVVSKSKPWLLLTTEDR